MSDTDEDLEALFEEMASQPASPAASNTATAAAATPVASAVLDPITDEAIPLDVAPDGSLKISKPMFERLGGVVRVLHDSMRELGYDRSLTDLTSQITDAHERLDYIATLTEKAANTVLNATDEAMPEQDNLAKRAKDIDDRWSNLFSGQMSIEAFKTLANDSQNFAKETIASTEAEKARLLAIMMSQDFQDLTGQLIKKVLKITGDIECELAQILLDNAPAEIREKAVELLEGPSVAASALVQDDVDNLLDSLGF